MRHKQHFPTQAKRQQKQADAPVSAWPSVQQLDRRIPFMPHEPSDTAWG
ncbi:hypothetical protein OS242_13420 [Tumebacillus sp. DT12]|uniref:Uncharacterized protein n=1 Tax=Tumebacillus lacus TaxID=2995335 RepID=A0ABT3X231_9BACL|nr:hypothetical protein [Tumebacillus lacus]MCX7570943.1 hypothetical protein [Tumebacillus lacus]